MKRWSLKLKNKALDSAYSAFLSNMDKIVRFHIMAEVASDICMQVKDEIPGDIEFKLSNNFSDGFTTIRTYGDGVRLIENGDFTNLNRRQTLLSICSTYESFISTIHKLFNLNGSFGRDPEIKINSTFNGQQTLRNGTVKAIRAIHNYLNISSPLNNDHEIEYINIIFLARNSIVHNQGVVTEKQSKLLKRKWRDLQKDDVIVIASNDIDDFIHAVLMPTKSMLMAINDDYE